MPADLSGLNALLRRLPMRKPRQATPMNDWIPSWISMPTREDSSTHSDWLLVTVEANDTRIVWFARQRFLDRTWWDPEGRAVLGVTAWRELPEPFHETMTRRQSVAEG
jgi:hypothetical protein